MKKNNFLKIIQRNIFLTNTGDIKVGDLGLSKLIDKKNQKSSMVRAGTINYMSPELVIDEDVNYTNKIDIW